MRKVYNFGAGPAMLPEAVLLKAQKEMLDWKGTGVSLMEIGHRTPEFQALADQSEADLRELMAIPSNYKIFFLPGGATAQFSMVPMNLLGINKKADYIDTGVWSKKAIAEAKRFGDINIAAAACEENGILSIPEQDEWKLNPSAAYLHYTANETISGLEFQWVPDTGNVPLAADMTSLMLAQPIDVSQFGIIYASAQKNLGQAGVTIVIIRDDLIREPVANTPATYMYKTYQKYDSFYNTPPTYSWYISSLVLSWLKEQGGVEAIYKVNQRKAARLYAVIDESKGFYESRIAVKNRSLCSVSFYLKNDALTEQFISEAHEAGLAYLKGHRFAGGIRACIYNAMPEEGVNALADFMLDFAKRNG